ncbi:MAG: carbohydrate-binding protein [Chloroflexi bacterium]|nr:carbohydrate-binding protein [Chloroflexota bacterium]
MKKSNLQFVGFVLIATIAIVSMIFNQINAQRISQSELTPFFLPLIVKESSSIASGTATFTPNPAFTATATSTPTPTMTVTPSPTATSTPPYCLLDIANRPYYFQFENYGCAGEGFSYHDSDVNNIGGEYRLDDGVDLAIAISPYGNTYYVGWTETGEWLQYDIFISYPGEYRFTFYVSSVDGDGRFHLEIDDIDVTGTLAIPESTDVYDWQAVWSNNGPTYIDAGMHTFKIVIENGGGNYDMALTYGPAPTNTPMP